MAVGTNIKIIIGIIVILALGFIAFEVLTVQSPDIKGKNKSSSYTLDKSLPPVLLNAHPG
jgi:hypothetical protein